MTEMIFNDTQSKPLSSCNKSTPIQKRHVPISLLNVLTAVNNLNILALRPAQLTITQSITLSHKCLELPYVKQRNTKRNATLCKAI